MSASRTTLVAAGGTVELPLATSGLSLGVGIKKLPQAAVDPLKLPLATSGLSVGVGGVKR